MGILISVINPFCVKRAILNTFSIIDSISALFLLIFNDLFEIKMPLSKNTHPFYFK